MRRFNLVQASLWLALILALVGSLRHVAWAFATLENGDLTAGYVQAVAVDVGLATLAYGIHQRRRERRPTRVLWLGVAVFSLISAYANLLHGLYFASDLGLSTWASARPFALSGVLPVLVVYLSEIVSSDVQHAVKVAERERRAAERRRRRAAHQESSDEHPDSQSSVVTVRKIHTKRSTLRGAGGVYLMRSNGAGLVRIGESNNINKRYHSHKYGVPEGVEFLVAFETDQRRELEAILQAKVAGRLTNGSWYDLSDDDIAKLIAYVKENYTTSRGEQQTLSKAEVLDMMVDIWREQPDIPMTELADRVGRSRSTLYTYLDELERQGRVRRNGQGVEVVTGG